MEFCRGPGWEISDLESNRIIGQNQADKAIELFERQPDMVVSGPIDYRQKFWKISKAIVERPDGTKVSLCDAAMVSLRAIYMIVCPFNPGVAFNIGLCFWQVGAWYDR